MVFSKMKKKKINILNLKFLMEIKSILKILLAISIITISISFNCKINSNDKCPINTVCNESGICVCDSFIYGENCDKKLSDLGSLSLNKGISLSNYLTLVSLLSISLPLILITGLFLIFIFLKGRDGTYTT